MLTTRPPKPLFSIISGLILLRMRNVSDKRRRGNQNTHYIFSNFLFENRDIYEIMWKNFVGPDRPQMTIWPMRITCWLSKATHTLTVCNTYCFPTALMLARRRLKVTFIRTLTLFIIYPFKVIFSKW